MVSEHKLYLLDTNILSDMMRNPVGLAAQHMRAMQKQSETLDAPPRYLHKHHRPVRVAIRPAATHTPALANPP